MFLWSLILLTAAALLRWEGCELWRLVLSSERRMWNNVWFCLISFDIFVLSMPWGLYVELNWSWTECHTCCVECEKVRENLLTLDTAQLHFLTPRARSRFNTAHSKHALPQHHTRSYVRTFFPYYGDECACAKYTIVRTPFAKWQCTWFTSFIIGRPSAGFLRLRFR